LNPIVLLDEALAVKQRSSTYLQEELLDSIDENLELDQTEVALENADPE
jgi:hypothetical protein